MHEFESTVAGKPPQSHTSVAYDPRDGRIVYTHEFIGDGQEGPAGQAERERTVLEALKRHGKDGDELRLLHLPEGFRRDMNKLYRVDAKAGALIVRADVSVEALAAGRLNRKKPKS